MPSLFKRSNGVYYICYEEDGKRRWRSTGQTIKPAALKELIAFQTSPRKLPSRITLQSFIEEFLAYGKITFAPKTVEIYDRALHKLLSFAGNKVLSSVIPRDVDLYRAHRLSEVSPTSVNIDLRTLRAAFYTAVRWKLIPENPFKKVPFVRIPDRQPAYLTKEDFEGLLPLVSERWLRELIIASVSTGMRRGELLNLRWKDLDFERRLINIQSSDIFRTKGGKRRSVPMNDIVSQILWEKAQRSLGEYVFTLHGRKIDGNWVTCKFRRYIRRAGLNPKLHFHSLRHTFATWLVQGGVSIYEIQKLLGHSNIAVTQIYSHLTSSELHDAVNKISVPLN